MSSSNSPTCAVESFQDGACPGSPVYEVLVDGDRLFLCRTCYQNILGGMYGPVEMTVVRGPG